MTLQRRTTAHDPGWQRKLTAESLHSKSAVLLKGTATTLCVIMLFQSGCT